MALDLAVLFFESPAKCVIEVMTAWLQREQFENRDVGCSLRVGNKCPEFRSIFRFDSRYLLLGSGDVAQVFRSDARNLT